MNYTDLIDLNDKELSDLISLVYKHTGISMSLSKKTLLQGRIRPRLKDLNLKQYSDYIVYLKNNDEEIQSFINLATTNETYFFRTTRVWQHLQEELLTKWYLENKGKKIKIWSAASSTGEEAYSIGICCENMRKRHADFDYEIIASDISTQVLEVAKKGLYKGRSIDFFKTNHPHLFEEFMNQEGESYTARKEIKNKIIFQKHNLFELNKKMNGFDLVFLRNVLIYFSKEDQEKVLENLYRSMNSAGELIIGESESLSSLETSFKYYAPLFYKKAA